MEKELNLKEIQQEELLLLKKTIKILNDNNLSYYLYGGTLLGAIRHKGFIPWDDDIDILIPRPDYNKLLNIIEKNNMYSSDFYPIAYELNNSEYPFGKILNKNIKLQSKNNIDNFLWIDIFPLDGIPNDKDPFKYLESIVNKRKIYNRKLNQIYKIKDSNKFKQIVKDILFFPIRFMNFKKILSRFVHTCKLYDYNDSNYVCDLGWASHPGNILKKEWLESDVEVDFEDIKAKAFIGYKEYLKNRYGNDYMELPPEEKRITHSFRAWRINNEK